MKKKVLFPILAVVLALSLALPMAAVVGAAPDDPIVYGMQRNTAMIYPVNPLDGTVGTPINTGLTGSRAGPNGLAYDSDNDDLYYTTYGGAATLYYWDIGTSASSTSVDTLGPGHVIADADFYNGNYYYINSATDDLYAVAVSAGTISGTNSYPSISGDAHSWTWGGDIAVSTDEEVIYAVGKCSTHGGNYEFFKVDLDGGNFTMIDANVFDYSLQLAFGVDGKLYGHESRNSGNFYEIDLTTGDLSSAFPNATNYLYTDCASGPRQPEANPSLEITKTAIFEGRATIGNTIDYTFEVYNDGDVPLTDLDVIDDLPVIIEPVDEPPGDGHNDGDTNMDDIFDPGETWYYTGTYGPLDEGDIASCMLENTATATAFYGTEEVTDEDSASVPVAKTVTLTAGQHIDVGTVEIWNDGEYIHVTYRTIDGWYITETHLHVAGSMEEIPQTEAKGKGKGKSGGNPIPGHFDYSDCFTPAVTEVTYDVELDTEWPTPIAIAAHAVVIKVEGDCEDPFWATGYTSDEQEMGWNTAGDPVAVATNRSNPDEVLGEPDGVFYSLGEGGSIIVDFGYPIFNGDGDYDISVHEISRNRGDPTENADVYVIVDGDEYYAGSVSSSDQDNGIGTVSIPDEFLYVDAVKIVDTTDKLLHIPRYSGDGYDVDAVDACFLVVQEETAWGGMLGELINVQEFPGANWATWIEYHVMSCPEPPNDH